MRSFIGGSCAALLLVLASACEGEEIERPYDTVVRCQDAGDPPVDTVEEAIARVDLDDDGALTDLDLPREREGRAVIRLEGVHEATGEASEEGLSLHGDFDPLFGSGQPGSWSVQLALRCVPVATVAIGFTTNEAVIDTGGRPPPPPPLEVGSYPARSMGVDVWTHEVGSHSTSEVVGTVHVTEVTERGVSGWFEGRATAPLQTWIPDERATGQSLTVEALAFRDVPIT